MDDDVLVHHGNLRNVLESHRNYIKKETFICKLFEGGIAIRDPQSKWQGLNSQVRTPVRKLIIILSRFVPKYQYLEKKFPPYCSGPLYILTIPALEKLVQVFEQEFERNFNWMDDVYQAGVLANLGNISHLDMGGYFLQSLADANRFNYPDIVGIHVNFVASLGSRRRLEFLTQFWESHF